MDEQGFEFQEKSRREARKFEPPPWEQDAFEQLNREREKPAEDPGAPAQAEAPGTEPPAQAGEAEEPTEERVSRQEDRREKEAGGELDEGRVLEMLAALTAEEPRETYDKVSYVVGAGIAVLGAVLIFWGMAALASARATGAMGFLAGAGLFAFGALFIGMGVWLVYRTLKQRGVL